MSMERRVEISLSGPRKERWSFRVTIEGEEYAMGSCGSKHRAVEEAMHYAFVELAGYPPAVGKGDSDG